MPGNIRRHDDHLNEAHPSHPVTELSKLSVVALDELLVGPAGLATLELNRDETAVGRGCNPSTKYPLLDRPSVVDDEENNSVHSHRGEGESVFWSALVAIVLRRRTQDGVAIKHSRGLSQGGEGINEGFKVRRVHTPSVSHRPRNARQT